MAPRRLLAATLLLSAGLAAHAATIYSNLQTGSTDYNAAGIEGSNFTYEAIADEFTSGTATLLTETQAAVIGFTLGDSNFNELLFSDNNGVPGALVATLATDLTAPQSGGIVDVAGLSVALSSSTEYWLALTPFDSNSVVGWEQNGALYQPTAVNQSGSASSGWQGGANSSDQFAVYDTPASVTPEPGSFALLGTGVLGVVGAIRRRLVA